MRTTLARIGCALACRRLWDAASCSVWTPVLGKVLLWLGAFVGLAHVGSGATARLLGAEPLLPQASAAALGVPGASAAPGDPAHAVQNCDKEKGGSSGAGAVNADGRVVLNLAAEADLLRLPGIGPKRAKAILDLRATLGKFRRLQDLLRVRGIGFRSLRRIEPLVLVDPPAEKKDPSPEQKKEEVPKNQKP